MHAHVPQPKADGDEGGPPGMSRKGSDRALRRFVTSAEMLSPGAGDTGTAGGTITLLPVKRANNVEIALSRLRISNDEVRIRAPHPLRVPCARGRAAPCRAVLPPPPFLPCT